MSHSQFCRVCLLLVALTGALGFSQAQNTAEINWFFGNNTNSIRFPRPNLLSEQITLPNALSFGGGAVATDPIKSEVLFYTDGVNVYNLNDVLINAGNPLDGSLVRNQSVAICHDPADPEGDNSRIYIFTINDAGIIASSVFDQSASFATTFPFPSDGNLTSTNQTTNLPAGTLSEGMIIVSNATRDGFWLITHNLGTSDFNITQIDATGISTPITATNIAGAPTSIANFSYHEGTNRISLSPSNPGENIFILDIDTATGTLSDAGFDLSALTNIRVYDTEWTTSGDSLYISGNFGVATDEIIKIDITQTPVVSEIVITADIQTSFGLEKAPDGFIYHIYEAALDGEFQVGRIENPDNNDILQVLYAAQPFGDIDFLANQFPAFLPPYNLLETADFEFSGTCANVPTYFFPQVTPDIESIFWDFGDMAGTSNAVSPQYTYTAAGTFNVVMRVVINGDTLSATNTVDIIDFDLTIQVDPQQQYWCPEDFPVTYTATAQGQNATGATLRWSNQTPAEASGTGVFEEPGTYYVVATDPSTGCEAYLEQQVFEYGTQNTFAFVWYFGNNAGLDFNPLFDVDNPGPITPIDPGGTEFNGGNLNDNAPAGAAVYCDGNGDPLIYSDGMQVYNRDNTLITSDLGGNDQASQSVLIVENPADATLYYVFFTQQVPDQTGSGIYDFSYAVYDLKELNGGGDLIRDAANNVVTTTLFNCNSERITGNANNVIIHEYGNNNFRVYPITAQGIGAPIISNVGRIHPFTNTAGQGYMKLSGDNRIAVALSEGINQNFVELFDFDPATGAITEVATLDLTPETGQVYGVEFSPDNEKVFATLRNSNGGTKIFWWDLIDNTVTPTELFDEAAMNATRVLVAEESGIDLGALQQGPNGTIYIANEGAGTLASIGNPTVEPVTMDPTTEFAYNLATPDFPNVGAGATSRIGLPNFINFQGSSTPTPGITVADACLNEQITFTVSNPLPDAVIEFYAIQVEDPNGVVSQSPTLDVDNPTWIFTGTQTAGVYEVRFFILDNCSTVDSPAANNPEISNFTVNPLPDAVIVGTTPPGNCGEFTGSATVDFNDAGALTYSVSGPISVPSTVLTGPQTGVVIPNLGAGFYTLNVTIDATGCVQPFTFTVDDPTSYTVSLNEATQADCNGENGTLSFTFGGTGVPTDFDWTVTRQSDNVPVDSGDETRTTTNPINAGDYFIEVLNNADGCTVVDNGTITIPATISLTIDPGPYSACDVNEIAIDVTTDGSALIELREIIGNTISDVAASNFRVIGNNDSIVVENPGTGGTTFNYAVVAPGTLTGPCTNFAPITVSFDTSSPNPYPPRFALCPFELDSARRFAFLDNQPNGFSQVQWFDRDGVEIIQTSASGDTNFPNDYFFSPDGSVFIVAINQPISAVLTNISGCTTDAAIDIVEDCEGRINAPTAFYPNSQIQLNQQFIVFPFLVESEDFQIYIFNRWGEMIFQSSNLQEMQTTGWNGGYDNDPGRPLPGGAYAYKVEFRSQFEPEKGLIERRGGVNLIR
ncbi:MAG: gliding motility-associated C-terminal domain-containing protein [Bacteroidota bacterium]